MNRKMFLKRSALTVLGMSMVGSVVKAEDGKFSGDCKTTSDILGPFYRPNAPVRSDLTSPDLAGTRITVKGKVFAGDCDTPLNQCKGRNLAL
jgi:catechol 1,2-dioxygenase